MKRHIMKYTANSLFPEIAQQSGPHLNIAHLNIIHMCIMAAFFRYIRLFYLALCCKMCKVLMIIIINFHSFIKNFITLFQLCIQICCTQLTWKIRGTIVHPAVLVNLSAEELASVCTFFSENFRFLLIIIIIKENCSALTHSIILGLMEAVTSKISDSSKSFTFVIGIHSLSRVFNNFQIIFLRDCHNRIHLAGNSCIMDRYDSLCLLCNCRLDQFFIYIHCIRSDINKYDFCSF